jgi:hypothetical protein
VSGRGGCPASWLVVAEGLVMAAGLRGRPGVPVDVTLTLLFAGQHHIDGNGLARLTEPGGLPILGQWPDSTVCGPTGW